MNLPLSASSRLDAALLTATGACLLLAAALVLSLVLLRQSLKGGLLPGCGPGSACDDVAKGRWGRLGPIPVSLLGALNYLALLVGAIMVHPALSTPRPWPMLIALALLTFIVAAWFMLLQLGVIRRLCIYCTTAHFCAVCGCLLLLRQALGASPPPDSVRWAVLAGVVPGLGLVLLQIAIRPRTYAVVPTPPAADPTPPQEPLASAPAPASAPAASPAPRRIHVMRDQISLSLHLWPVLGPRDAEHVIIDLLDYTCHDCRHMHNLLVEAVRHYDGRLAVIPMPVPMHPACNPHVRAVNPHHQFACPIARTALAVWRANPDAFEEFDRWVFEPENHLPVETIEAEARRRVGPDAFQTALEDPWLAKRLNEAIEIYAAVGGGRVPNILTPLSMVQGRVPDLAQMIEILDQQLAAPTPAATK